LKGARFVAAVEAEGGRRLAESLIKQLTGQDTITARFLHQEFFEFEPTFKIWLAANHKPLIRGDDDAIWRRVRLIPFAVVIPPEERDRDLHTKLQGELPGILNWAIEGCLKWQQHGLGLPEEVKAATNDYRSEMDTIANFIEECCFQSPQVSSTAKNLYRAYCEWCESYGERTLSQKLFGMKLSERGFERNRGTGGRTIWNGIGVVDYDHGTSEGFEGSEGSLGVFSLREGYREKKVKSGSLHSKGSLDTQPPDNILNDKDFKEKNGFERAW